MDRHPDRNSAFDPAKLRIPMQNAKRSTQMGAGKAEMSAERGAFNKMGAGNADPEPK